MGSEVEEELLGMMNTPTPTPWKLLQIHTTTSHDVPPSPARTGMQTPPFHTAAAIPFRWEEEPGKPWPCTALILVPKQQEDSSSKSLGLPPRLLNEAITAAGGRLLEGLRPQGSYLQIGGECCRSSLVLEGKFPGWGASGFCKSGWRGKRNAIESGSKMDIFGSSSYVFPSGDSREGNQDCCFGVQEKGKGSIRKAGSFPLLTHTRSHFWRSIWEGLKGARSRRRKGMGL